MSTDTVITAMRENQEYSVEQIHQISGVSKSYAGTCLRELVRGGVVDRRKVAIGKTKCGKDKEIFFYKTRQKDLPI
jgi:predicted transcriptional regulator